MSAPRDPAAVAIGRRITMARERQGVTQAELARALPPPITSQYVSRWETGATKPSLGNLQALAGALNVTVSWLLQDL